MSFHRLLLFKSTYFSLRVQVGSIYNSFVLESNMSSRVKLTWQRPPPNKNNDSKLVKRSPLNPQPDLPKVTQKLQRQKDHSQHCDCVSWLVLEPGMWAIWFPTGKPVGGLSNASNTQLIWQISRHWPQNQPADYRRRWRNDTEKERKLERVTGRAGGNSVSHLFTTDIFELGM